MEKGWEGTLLRGVAGTQVSRKSPGIPGTGNSEHHRVMTMAH